MLGGFGIDGGAIGGMLGGAIGGGGGMLGGLGIEGEGAPPSVRPERAAWAAHPYQGS